MEEEKEKRTLGLAHTRTHGDTHTLANGSTVGGRELRRTADTDEEKKKCASLYKRGIKNKTKTKQNAHTPQHT